VVEGVLLAGKSSPSGGASSSRGADEERLVVFGVACSFQNSTRVDFLLGDEARGPDEAGGAGRGNSMSLAEEIARRPSRPGRCGNRREWHAEAETGREIGFDEAVMT